MATLAAGHGMMVSPSPRTGTNNGRSPGACGTGGQRQTQGVIAATLVAGEEVEVSWRIDNNHRGTCRISLTTQGADVPSPVDNQGRLDASQPQVHALTPDFECANSRGVQRRTVTIPEQIECESCVLQWSWSWGNNNCADVRVTSSQTSPSPAAPTPAPSTNVATTSTNQPAVAGGSSSLAVRGYETEIEVGPGVKLHYATPDSDDNIRLAIEVPVTGWAGLAIGTAMSDGDAVIGGGLKGGGQASDVKAYTLSTYDVNVNEDATSQLSATEVIQDNGKTFVLFTRPLNNNVNPISFDATIPMLYAYGPGSSIEYHASRSQFTVNLATGTAAEDTTSRDHKAIHGVLMLMSWGFLIPLGTLTAAWGGARFKVGGPKLFNAHRWLQSLGLFVSLAGVAYAMMLIYNGSIVKIAELPLHGMIGLAVTTLGVLQPLNAFLRPHGDGMLRSTWELLHKTSGRLATVAGLLNCMLGACVAKQQEGDVTILSTLLPASFAMSFSTLISASFAMTMFFCISYVGGKVLARMKLRRLAEAADIEAQVEKEMRERQALVNMEAAQESPVRQPVLLSTTGGNVQAALPKETDDMVHDIVSVFLAKSGRQAR